MKINVTKAVVKSLSVSENVANSVQVNCESVCDFANMDITEILASGGCRKYVFFLRNCADKLPALNTALLNKETNVCVYEFAINELIADKTTVVIDNDGETSTFTSLTYVLPCKEGFEPNADDADAVKSTLLSQINVRVQNGTYTLQQCY